MVDNAKYFDSVIFMGFYQQIGTKVAFASVYHPQTNEAVERVNCLIFEAIKKILAGEKKGKWVEVMPQVVWSHNTTVCRATNSTPFWLMYGAKAILPEEVKHRSLRTVTASPTCPSEAEEKTCCFGVYSLRNSFRGKSPSTLSRRELAFEEKVNKSQELEILITPILGVSKSTTPKSRAGPDPRGTYAG
jgi:hypothetical protein